MIDPHQFDLMGMMLANAWCRVVHRKHQKWTGNWRRDCLKCGSWTVWPTKYAKAMAPLRQTLDRMHAAMMERLRTPISQGGDASPAIYYDPSKLLFFDGIPTSAGKPVPIDLDEWPDVIGDV
jgi:hypothetical protein